MPKEFLQAEQCCAEVRAGKPGDSESIPAAVISSWQHVERGA